MYISAHRDISCLWWCSVCFARDQSQITSFKVRKMWSRFLEEFTWSGVKSKHGSHWIESHCQNDCSTLCLRAAICCMFILIHDTELKWMNVYLLMPEAFLRSWLQVTSGMKSARAGLFPKAAALSRTASSFCIIWFRLTVIFSSESSSSGTSCNYCLLLGCNTKW